MSSCIESCLRVNCNLQDTFDDSEKRNKIISIIAGSFFFIGWWIIIDISARHSSVDFSNAYHVCGVLGTISLFMINAVSTSRIEMYQYGVGNYPVHIWIFFGFVLGFGSLIASIWILFGAYVMAGIPVGPGLGVFFQNLFIFTGSIIFKFGRKEEFEI